MSTPNPDFRKRWTKSKVVEVERILDASPVDLNLLKIACGVVESSLEIRIDLRGFPFQKKFSEKQFIAVDFSFCSWKIGIGGLRPLSAVDCCFSSCNLEGALNDYFENCDFTGAKIVDCLAGPGTTFNKCNFRNATFRNGSMLECILKNCSFEKAKFRNIEFEECVFDCCDFIGCEFRRAAFGGSKFINVKNNFNYADELGVNRVEKIVDAKLPMVDCNDSFMIGVDINRKGRE